MKPVERVSVLEQVVAKLKEHIASGDYTAGDRFPSEKEIGEQLQVGRSTIREALRVLQTLGLVRMLPGKGAYVASTDTEDLRTVVNWFEDHGLELNDFFDVRMAIEPLAARLAAERATAEEVTRISGIHTAFAEALEAHDGVRLAILDETFHGFIVDSTHNKLLVSINDNIKRAFFEYRSKVLATRRYAVNALEPHRGILEAIRSHQGERAEQAMVEHLRISVKDIRDILAVRDEAGPA